VTQKASDAAVDLAGDIERRTREFRADAAETATAAGEYAANTVQAARNTLHDATDAASSRAAQFRQAAASSAAELKGKADEFGRTVSSGVDDLRRRATSGVDDLSRRAAATGEAFAGEAGDLADKGAGFTDAVAGSIHDAAASVRDTAASVRDSAVDAASRLRSTISETADAGREAAFKARDRAAELGDQAGKTFVDTVAKNPMLVAGIGLVLGGLIASAIPRLRFERETLGKAADDLKNRASETVTRGFEAAKEAASAVVEDVVRAADNEGLSADGVAGTVTDIGKRARKVAEAATSSFETPSQNKH
jgi:hypothetical protein